MVQTLRIQSGGLCFDLQGRFEVHRQPPSITGEVMARSSWNIRDLIGVTNGTIETDDGRILHHARQSADLRVGKVLNLTFEGSRISQACATRVSHPAMSVRQG